MIMNTYSKQTRDTFYTTRDVCILKRLFEEGKNIRSVVAITACFMKRCFLINLLSVSPLQADK